MLTSSNEICPYRPLAQAVRRVPSTKGNRPVHTSTMVRWITKGVKAANGTVVRLEARRFPGGWKVADQAIEEFLDKLTAAALSELPEIGQPPLRSAVRRSRDITRAERELDAAGI